jgi:hypothetical protein
MNAPGEVSDHFRAGDEAMMPRTSLTKIGKQLTGGRADASRYNDSPTNAITKFTFRRVILKKCLHRVGRRKLDCLASSQGAGFPKEASAIG